jgi:hypothetical protein
MRNFNICTLCLISLWYLNEGECSTYGKDIKHTGNCSWKIQRKRLTNQHPLRQFTWNGYSLATDEIQRKRSRCIWQAAKLLSKQKRNKRKWA